MSVLPELGSRALFPTLEARAYLAHAGVSPLSEPVCAAIQGTLARYAERGIAAAIAQAAQREELREALASLIHVAPAQLGLVQSMSIAATVVARSIGLSEQHRVVLFDGEFPGNVVPFQNAAREAGASFVRLPLAPFMASAERGLATLEAELRRAPVRLVAVSAVQYQTGLAMPVAELAALCHRHGAELFVDAIQAVGVMPFDATALDVDYAAASGHKFLMGPEGTGFLYAHPRALGRMTRGFAGWASPVDAFRFLAFGPGLVNYDAAPAERMGFVEQGAQNTLGHAGLLAAVTLLRALTPERVFAHVTRYLDALEPEVVALGCRSLRKPWGRSALLCLELPRDAPPLHEVSAALAARAVVASTPDGFLRFAPHFANALAEIPHVRAALAAALQRPESADTR